MLQASPNNPSKARSILRALLREATYLPDAAARTYFRHYIVSRFRENQANTNVTKSVLAGNGDLARSIREKAILRRLPALYQQAEKGLSVLRRANAGHVAPLTKVLAHTYGRIGKRRWALLRPVLKVEELEESGQAPPDHDAQGVRNSSVLRKIPAAVDGPYKIEKRDKIEWRVSPRYARLQALVQGQARHRVVGFSPFRKPIRSDRLSLPASNSWARPMPLRRQKNKAKEWYRTILYRAWPPLPENEYQRLHDLAFGKVPWEDGVARRKAARTQEIDDNQLKVTLGGLPVDAQVKSQKVLSHLLGTSRISERNNHRITARFLRRIWLKIIQQIPVMSWDTDEHSWKVTWCSNTPNHLHPLDKESFALFEGVDRSGFVHRQDESATYRN